MQSKWLRNIQLLSHLYFYCWNALSLILLRLAAFFPSVSFTDHSLFRPDHYYCFYLLLSFCYIKDCVFKFFFVTPILSIKIHFTFLLLFTIILYEAQDSYSFKHHLLKTSENEFSDIRTSVSWELGNFYNVSSLFNSCVASKLSHQVMFMSTMMTVIMSEWLSWPRSYRNVILLNVIR